MPPPPSGANQPVTVSRLQMQLHLQGLQQNTNALRKQLSQLRNMQVCVRILVNEKGLKQQYSFVYVQFTSLHTLVGSLLGTFS